MSDISTEKISKIQVGTCVGGAVECHIFCRGMGVVQRRETITPRSRWTNGSSLSLFVFAQLHSHAHQPRWSPFISFRRLSRKYFYHSKRPSIAGGIALTVLSAPCHISVQVIGVPYAFRVKSKYINEIKTFVCTSDFERRAWVMAIAEKVCT